MLNEFVVY